MTQSFLGFVRKEFHHILRDRRTLVVLFGMPVIMMVLFGFAIRNEISDIRVIVWDLSRDHVTAEVVAKLRASEYFEVIGYAGSYGDVESAFERGEAMVAIVFGRDFAVRVREGTAQVQVITDATNPNVASTVLAYTRSVLSDYARRSAARDGAVRVGAMEPPAIRPEFRMRYNPELRSVYLFVPGLIALILMLVSALMTSITIARERESGTMEVLLVSPLHPLQIIAGKVVPYLALSLANVATILFLATTLFAVPIRGSIVFLLFECLLFIVCALSLGILISARSNSMQTATMIALAGLLMPTVLLSGFIFPIASMPAPLQILSHVIPAKWFLLIARGTMIRGVGIEMLWKETLVLAGMTVFFLAVALRSFKIRLE